MTTEQFKAIQEKVLKGEELTDEEKSALQSFELPAPEAGTKQLDEAKAAQGRILEEKKTLQARNDELTKKLADIQDADLTESEKLNKSLEASNARIEALTQELESAKTATNSMERTHAVDRIHSGIPWHREVINADHSRALLDNALRDIDLSDETAVSNAMASFNETIKGLTSAKVNGGSGTKNGGSGGEDAPHYTASELSAIRKSGDWAKHSEKIREAEAADNLTDD